MKFLSGIVLGILLSMSINVIAAQNEKAMHPRIAKAIAALKDARAYMMAAPHDFGGHRAEAGQSHRYEAIKQLNFALAYRAGAFADSDAHLDVTALSGSGK